MNEFDLIARLIKHLPANDGVVVGPGDDCAVVDLGAPDHDVLFKTDAVVEGIHFTGDTPPELVGRKALARCLSDIAAMAGAPRHAVVTLGLPEEFNPATIEKLYAGMTTLAAAHGVAVVGGETTTNPGRLLVSVALLGVVAKGRALLRSGARAGDAIFVTGTLGGSLAGRHLDFEPRLREARFLADQLPVRSMIDLSDGLAGDLRQVLRASGVGAELLESAIPVSRAARQRHRDGLTSKTPLIAAFTDGEDFELLFTLPAGEAVRAKDLFRAEFPDVPLTCIGKIIPDTGLKIRGERGLREMAETGYAHFAKN